MEEYQLQTCYDHCKHMLYNSDIKNPGRMVVLDQITQQLLKCNAELALRWFLSLTDKSGNNLYSPLSLILELRGYLNSVPNTKIYHLKDFLQVPNDYKNVAIITLIEAARDNLGYFDHSKISRSFIARLGIYFTPQELEEMKQFTVGNTMLEKIEVLKTQLGLRDDLKVLSNAKGLNEKEFTDMIHLKKFKKYQKCKYSELTTGQLETLVKKVLFSFEEEVLHQVSVWKNLMSQIEEVAKYKKYNLK